MPKYIVLVTTPPKATSHTMASSGVSIAPTTVQRLDCRTLEDAAQRANVPPGGYAEIVAAEDCRRFDRAERAPLVEKAPDGNPLPTVQEMPGV